MVPFDRAGGHPPVPPKLPSRTPKREQSRLEPPLGPLAPWRAEGRYLGVEEDAVPL